MHLVAKVFDLIITEDDVLKESKKLISNYNQLEDVIFSEIFKSKSQGFRGLPCQYSI